jgi:hypothetical protein
MAELDIIERNWKAIAIIGGAAVLLGIGKAASDLGTATKDVASTVQTITNAYDETVHLPQKAAEYVFNTGISNFDRDANQLIATGLSAEEAYNKTVAQWTNAGLDIFGLFKSTNYIPSFFYFGGIAPNLTQADGSADTYSMPITSINAVETAVDELFPNLVTPTLPEQVITPPAVEAVQNVFTTLFSPPSENSLLTKAKDVIQQVINRNGNTQLSSMFLVQYERLNPYYLNGHYASYEWFLADVIHDTLQITAPNSQIVNFGTAKEAIERYTSVSW